MSQKRVPGSEFLFWTVLISVFLKCQLTCNNSTKSPQINYESEGDYQDYADEIDDFLDRPVQDSPSTDQVIDQIVDYLLLDDYFAYVREYLRQRNQKAFEKGFSASM